MRNRTSETAKHFGILGRVEELERRLLDIEHVVSVDFDLDGFWSDIHQVILVPEYDIPVDLPNYYDVRSRMLQEVLAVAREFGLGPSGDAIEDYGKHYYIVRDCDASWKKEKDQSREEEQTGRKTLNALIEEAELNKGGPDDGGPGGALAMDKAQGTMDNCCIF